MKKHHTLLLSLFVIIISSTNTFAQKFIWTKKISDDNGIISSEKIAIDNSGNSYVTGFFSETASFDNIKLVSNGGYDIFIAKYDSLGAVQWAVKAGGAETDKGTGIGLDNSGNIYISGNFTGQATFENTKVNATGNDDIYIAKYNNSGQLKWVKHGGGTGQDNSNDLATNSTGSILLTGTISENANFDNFNISPQNGQTFIAQYDSSGTIESIKQTSGIGNAITVDNAGNIYITGSYVTNVNNDNQTFILKLNSAGTQLWRFEATDDPNSISDPAYEQSSSYGNDIAIDHLGNVFITGTIIGKAIFGNNTITGSILGSGTNIFFAKINSSGAVEFVKVIYPKNNGTENNGKGITVDNLGNFYLTGIYTDEIYLNNQLILKGSIDDENGFIIKFSGSGKLLWAKDLGGSKGQEYGKSIEVNSNQIIYLTGHYEAFFGTSSFDNIQLDGVGAFLSKIDQNDSEILSIDGNNSNKKEYYVKVKAYPNPINTGELSLTIEGDQGKMNKVFVEIMTVQGKSLYSSKVNCGIACPQTVIPIDHTYKKGVYIIKVSIDGQVYTEKLLIN